MDPRHKSMWSVVNEPADVLPAIHAAPPWYPESLSSPRSNGSLKKGIEMSFKRRRP